MASHREPKWCCVSSLTKIVTFFAVPFCSIPTPPTVLHQLSFFGRCEDFVPFDRRQKPIVCPTIIRETTLSIRAASIPGLRRQGLPPTFKPLQIRVRSRASRKAKSRTAPPPPLPVPRPAVVVSLRASRWMAGWKLVYRPRRLSRGGYLPSSES